MLQYCVTGKLYDTHQTEESAISAAQRIANSDGKAAVWRLVAELKPKPKLMPHDIDALIDNRKKRHKVYGGDGTTIACGILRQLKKMGVTHLDLPCKIEV